MNDLSKHIHKAWMCLLLFVLVFSFASCTSSDTQSDKNPSEIKGMYEGKILKLEEAGNSDESLEYYPSQRERSIMLRDNNGMLIQKFEKDGYLFLTKHGIVHTRTDSTLDGTKTAFYYYDITTNEDKLLGSIENAYFIAYYDSFQIDDCVYVQIETGDPFDGNTESNICVLNISSGEMTIINLGENCSPYTSMVYYNGSIYYRTSISKGTISMLWEYNIQTCAKGKKLEFNLDPSGLQGDHLLHIASDETYLYLLREAFIGEQQTKLFVDKYNSGLNLIESFEITDCLIPRGNEDGITDSDNNELRQPVFGFDIINNYIYYQNRGTTRALLIMHNNEESINCETYSILSSDTSKAYYSQPGETDLCYCQEGEKGIWIFDPQTNTTRQFRLEINGEAVAPAALQRNASGKLLITKKFDIFDNKSDLEVFFVDFSDLKMQ